MYKLYKLPKRIAVFSLRIPSLSVATTIKPDAYEEAEGKDEPPKPGVLVPHEVGAALHDQCPLRQRESETGEGAVTRGNCVTEAHEKHKPNLSVMKKQ